MKKLLAIYPMGVYNKARVGNATSEIIKREDVRMEEHCCCDRKKERTEEEYKGLIHRLNRIEGQIRGIRRMVEENAYCTDILVQSSAVTAAVNAFNKELLANHIRTCVAEDIRQGKDETIEDLVNTIQKMMK
jgi:DNA-binding FrmR family transcriptional regulator